MLSENNYIKQAVKYQLNSPNPHSFDLPIMYYFRFNEQTCNGLQVLAYSIDFSFSDLSQEGCQWRGRFSLFFVEIPFQDLSWQSG